jgi:hypothetical protein
MDALHAATAWVGPDACRVAQVLDGGVIGESEMHASDTVWLVRHARAVFICGDANSRRYESDRSAMIYHTQGQPAAALCKHAGGSERANARQKGPSDGRPGVVHTTASIPRGKHARVH